ncbi:HAD family phosphatase [Poseidonocella sp. HB161398]|uniref:HAD family hydrolase n=1 Tax=Poseidonocella sp. HB161398 TaxID=2320855 RepID=UPI001107F49B|nr:HAD family hydrolase [Poseidonocella sp. HB161398]
MAAGLVIFDCDGVLVDSEPISLDVLTGYLSEQGCALDHATGYRALLGRSMASVADWLRRERGFGLTQEMTEEMRDRLFARFAAELRPIPGVAAAVGALGRPACVASSSQPERIRRSLGLTGLLPLFEPHLFSATMVANGKPAPDLFLHAASEMGACPGDCTVIEDSPAGLEAARRAGMRAVAFTGGSHAGPAALRETVAKCAPDAIIDRMEDLPAILRQLG